MSKNHHKHLLGFRPLAFKRARRTEVVHMMVLNIASAYVFALDSRDFPKLPPKDVILVSQKLFDKIGKLDELFPPRRYVIDPLDSVASSLRGVPIQVSPMLPMVVAATRKSRKEPKPATFSFR